MQKYDANQRRETYFFLNQVPLIGSMQKEILDSLSTMLFERFFHSGQSIYNKAEPSMTFYIVKSGKVRLRCPLILDKYNQWPSVIMIIFIFLDFFMKFFISKG